VSLEDGGSGWNDCDDVDDDDGTWDSMLVPNRVIAELFVCCDVVSYWEDEASEK